MLYEKMFALDPDLRPLFKIDIATQGAKLMAVSPPPSPTFIGSMRSCRRCANWGAGMSATASRIRDFDTGGVALLETLDAALGDDFTPAVRDAWTACYQAITGEMKAAAAADRAASAALVD